MIEAGGRTASDPGAPELRILLASRSERGETFLRGALEPAGIRPEVILDGNTAHPADAVVFVRGNASWFPRLCRTLERTPVSERPFVVVWHSEPLPPPSSSGLPRPRLHGRELLKIAARDPRATDPYTNARRLRRLHRSGLPHLLVVSTAERKAFLDEEGIPSHCIPYGYAPVHGSDLGLHRDVDVLFLGDLNIPRRRRLLRELRRSGIAVVEKGGWSGKGVWGAERTWLLNRTRILLSFARHPGQLSGVRMILGMANKALVVSEPIWLPAPYVAGEHYVEAPVAELPAVIRYHLEHEDERRAIAEQGHRFVTRELLMERSVEQILELVRAARGS